MDGIRPTFVLLVIIPYVRCLMQWEMQNYCGQTIGQDEYAGEVTFNTNLPGNYGSICQIIITPKQTAGSGDLVLFYFTDFHLSILCHDSNVTIQEVSSLPFSPSEATTVLGVHNTICGENSTLNELVLATRYSHLVVTFKQSVYGRLYVKSTFNLKFASFHEGECGDSDFQCSNDRCLDESLKCIDEINPCGDDSSCPEKKIVDDFKAWFEKNLKWLVILVCVIAAYAILKQLHATCKERSWSASSIFHCLGKPCQDGRPHMDSPRRPSLTISMSSLDPTDRPTARDLSQFELEMSDRVSVSSDEDGRSLTSLDDDSSRGTHDPITPTAPPAYEDCAPVRDGGSMPAPPSYDEVIANEDIYKSSHT